MPAPEVNDEEIEELISDLHRFHGYNFANYSQASFKRRVNRLLSVERLPSFGFLQAKLRDEPGYVQQIIEELSVNVTEMFRDPSFYLELRNSVLPVLATKPFIRIWHAGCSTGEEVYSMAILLQEANLLNRSLLYATDLSPRVLETARRGIFPLDQMQLFSSNYRKAGGHQDFTKYYSANYNVAKFHDSLQKNMVISTHNLVSDSSFNEFQLIVCRNVLIYFDKQLQNRVFKLFNDSLEKLGFLALGTKETLKFSDVQNRFRPWPGKEKIWRKEF